MKKFHALLAVFMIWPGDPRAETYLYQPYAYQSYDGEGDAAIANYQHDRAILEQEREEQMQWDNFAQKHALPIARPDEPLSEESRVVESAPEFKVVHPPETTSGAPR